MKQFIFNLLLIPFLFLFVSCEQEQVLELDSPASVSVLEKGEAQTISFSTSHSWSIETADSWCHVSPSSGEGSNEIITVTVTCDENTSFEGRNTVLTLRSGNRVETITIVQNPREPRSVCIDLKQDTGRNAVLFLLQDCSYYVYENRENESIETLYYNSSLKKDLSEGIFFIKNNVDESLSMTYQGIVVVFNKIEGSTYNLALRNNDGETYYWYGVEIEEPIIDQLNFGLVSTGSTKAIDWHIVKWGGYKLLSFTTTAFATVYGGPLGVASLLLTMHAEYLKSSGQIYEDIDRDYVYNIENLSIFNDLSGSWLGWKLDASWSNLAKGWAFLLGTMILNDLADEEYKKIGEIKEDVIPELGYEWNIQITPRKLSCLNNDGQYTAHVKSKAAWKVDDSTVDKSWCHVEKSGEDLTITIKENPEPGFHSCYATVMQAVESNIYHINPVRFDIEMENAKFSVHPQELVFDSKGGTQTVTVSKSDNMIGWDIYMDRIPQWCTVSKNVANSSFDVTVGPSTTGHDAESIIVFGALDETTFYEYSVAVRQEKAPEEQLRQKLIRFYHDTGGSIWKRNDNWCSEKPLNEWYGVTVMNDGRYSLNLDNNGLSGYGDLSNTPLYTLSIWQDDNNSISLDLSNCRQLYKVVVSVNELDVSDSSVQSITGLDGDPIIKRLVARRSGLLGIGGFGRENKIDNIIEYIDVSGSNELDNIHATYCSKLTTIVADECKNLNVVRCTRSPKLESISVAGCDRLSMFSVDYVESLTQVDLSSCSGLKHFTCNYGGFTTADLSDCIQLEYLQFWHNPLSSISFPASPVLKIVALSDNALTSLDISQLPGLEQLYCANNHIIQEITPRFHEVFHWPNQISHQWEVYDRRYDYEWGYVNGNYVLINVIEHPYGWYYPGEPEKGYHGQ